MSINLDGFKTGANKLTTPAVQLGGVMVDTAEKFVAMQMDSCKVYSDIAFRELKKFPEVKSLEQAGDLLWGQIEPFSEFNKQLLNDWKSLMALNSKFTQDVKGVFSSQVAKSAAAKEETPKEPKPSASKAKATARTGKPVAVAE